MKKFLKLIATGFAFALLLVACEKPEKELLPSLTIQQPELIGATGGTFTLDYSIENPTEGTRLIASKPEVEWLKSIVVTATQVKFTVEAYLEGSAERTTSFSLTYGELTPTLINITQNPSDVEFEVSFAKVTPESVDVKVKPSDSNIKYLCTSVTQADIDFVGDAATYAQRIAENYVIGPYGDVLDELMYQGEQTVHIAYNSIPTGDHYIIVAGFVRDADNNNLPRLVTKPSLTYVILPPYPELYLLTEEAEQFSAEAGSYTLEWFVTNPIEGTELKISLSEGLEQWIHNIEVGDRVITFDYDANPYPVERNGTFYITYDYAYMATFHCSQAANKGAESVTFELDVKEIHYDRVVVDCTPSNLECKYVIGAIAKSDFESYSYNYGDSTKIPELDLSASYHRPTILTGAQTNYTVHNTAYNYAIDWYVYAYAVNDSEDAAASEVLMVPVELVNDAPYFLWNDEKVSGDNSSVGTMLVDAKPTTTYTVKFDLLNSHPTGVIVVEEPYDDTLIKGSDGKRVTLDKENQTITFTVGENTTGKDRITYVYLKYFSSEDATYSDANSSLKITQKRK